MPWGYPPAPVVPPDEEVGTDVYAGLGAEERESLPAGDSVSIPSMAVEIGLALLPPGTDDAPGDLALQIGLAMSPPVPYLDLAAALARKMRTQR